MSESNALVPFEPIYPIEMGEEFLTRYGSDSWIALPHPFHVARQQLLIEKWHKASGPIKSSSIISSRLCHSSSV